MTRFKQKRDPVEWDRFLYSLEAAKFKWNSECTFYYDYHYETENRFLSITDFVKKYDICRDTDFYSVLGIEYTYVKKECYNFLTLSPMPHLEYTDENKSKLLDFCTEIFNKVNCKKYHYVIESGKDRDNPHLHIHSLFVYNKGINKNFKRNVVKAFGKIFKANIDWYGKCGSKGWYNKIINPLNNLMYEEIIKDKLDYFENCKKGILHDNFEDLKLRGSSEDY